ncbi:MAG: pyruvate formate lyase family protein [Bacillota bacterium]
MQRKTTTNLLTNFLLRLMAAQYNHRSSLKKYLRNTDGWINFAVGFRTETGTVEQAIKFNHGRVGVLSKIPDDVDVTLRFVNDSTIMEMLSITPNEMLNLILNNKMILDGNMTYLQLFNYFVSLLMGKQHQRMMQKNYRRDRKLRKSIYAVNDPELSRGLNKRERYFMKGSRVDKGVKYLEDPYLSSYSISDFPRLQEFLHNHFTLLPQMCAERPKLLTEWYRANGFEYDREGNPWVPELRQAYAYKYLMINRKPIIAHNDLIAGTSTSKQPTGVLIYPDAQGTIIWGELASVEKRILNPYLVSEEDADILHDVFAYWAKRNFREWVRTNYHNPLCLQIDERWVYYFVWKSVGISHTIPDFPTVLAKGTKGIIREIERKLEQSGDLDTGQKNTLQAMLITLEGVAAYSMNLSKEAKRLAAGETDPVRKAEFERLVEICRKVPANPSETLDEAINAVWITWVALHMENTNTGLSLGRLDQWLQPYFENDIKTITAEEERQAYLKRAIELVGCLYMRGTDHLPLVPDIGNYLFGGSSSDQAITLGGVTPDGEDGVNDMTYIFLKVTEMLSIRDPNVNARFHLKKNSDTYLKRLCEVNFVTAATPSMHNDEAVFESLMQHGYPLEDIRDWAATGCVEPTLCGKHMGHTGSILMNMVSALEMALNNGRHHTMEWDLGPKTGSIEKSDFNNFNEFFQAFATQMRFLIDHAVELNNMLAEAHVYYRPTPLLSAFIKGAIDKGLDVTKGGALYNTSGTSNIGLADVTDSLMVIKKLVFDEGRVSFPELKAALDANFADNPRLHALVKNKVPLFGSGNPEALELANRVARFIHECYASHSNYRGGKYTSGFWSMSQHVAYGTLSGALPSGRLARKAFTPGLTPHPSASKNYLDNIRDVARLNPISLDNNIAFNVKLVPSAKDTREQTVDHMLSYVKTYFEQGGMQTQFNMVDSNVLKDAMANPEKYQNLLVRISGYNAYFVSLNKDMQIELIERAEYGL